MSLSSEERLTHTENSRMFGFLDCVQIVLQRFKMIAVITLVGAFGTAAYSLTQSNVYQCKAMIIPVQEDKNLMSSMLSQLGGLATLAGASVGAPTTGDLYVTMLHSETVLDGVIDRLHLMQQFKKKYRYNLYEHFDKAMEAVVGKKDGVVSITVKDTDPKRAADITNALLDELAKLTADLSVKSSGANRSFLEGRLASAKVDLAQAENALAAFQRKNKTIALPEQAQVSIGEISMLNGQIAIKEVELASTRQRFTEASPEVKMVKASIESMKQQIGKLEGNGGGSSIPSIGAVPALAQDYIRLTRQFKIQETLVEVLTKQYEMAKLAESKSVKSFNILQNAKVPEAKVAPARAKMVKVAAFLSLLLGLFVAFMREGIARMPEADKTRMRSLLPGYLKRFFPEL
ncbi:GumC family protein [Geomonas oryzae]|uniref:GumC family protein n=1 Tax=Geomonas oryzae TaxID=2364273 RepID=UPI00100B63F7|nr:Wzz/FepE/Etk N-terminal domain-containing protein [Geomonas oryzae]